MSGGSEMSVKVTTFLFISTIVLIIKAMQLQPNSSKVSLKPIGLGLNIRPYNRLNKEVADFKKYKGGLITLYNTKCFY